MSFRILLIQELIRYINEANITNGMKCKFDELKVNQDSLCISVSDKDDPGEVNADVTGTALAGHIDLEVFYRVVSNVQNNGDLEAIGFLDNICLNMRGNFAYRNDEGFLDRLVYTAAPKLFKAYKGNIRDFVAKVTLYYERRA